MNAPKSPDRAAGEGSGSRGSHISNGAEAANLPPDVDAPELTDDTNSEMIEQAKRDLDSGQVDTDLRSTPGIDADQKKRLLKKDGD